MATRRRRRLHVDPLTVVHRFVDAANRHDADAVAACVHRDFESLQPIHPARNFKGSAQLLTNWRAIFRTEPGFRLTMLRSAVDGDTVWVELHGAGRQAEVAGIFIIGVEDGLMRWARVYSELVEPLPEPVIPEPAALRLVTDGQGAGDEAPPEDSAEADTRTEAERAEARLSPEEEAAQWVPPQDAADIEVEVPAEAPPAADEIEVEAALQADTDGDAGAASEEIDATAVDDAEATTPPPAPPEEEAGAAAGPPEADDDATDTTAGSEEPPEEPTEAGDDLLTWEPSEVAEPAAAPPAPPTASATDPAPDGGWRRWLGRMRRGME